MKSARQKVSKKVLVLGAAVALLGGCVSDEPGVGSATANLSPNQTPIAGPVLSAVNNLQQEVNALPERVLESVVSPNGGTPAASSVVVQRELEREEDRRVLRRHELGLPMSAEDRVRERREERLAGATQRPSLR